jgi:hypothetical protein
MHGVVPGRPVQELHSDDVTDLGSDDGAENTQVLVLGACIRHTQLSLFTVFSS